LNKPKVPSAAQYGHLHGSLSFSNSKLHLVHWNFAIKCPNIALYTPEYLNFAEKKVLFWLF